MNLFTNNPSIIKEAEKAKFMPHFIIQILIFFAVFLVGQLGASIPLTFAIVKKLSFNLIKLDDNN